MARTIQGFLMLAAAMICMALADLAETPHQLWAGAIGFLACTMLAGVYFWLGERGQ